MFDRIEQATVNELANGFTVKDELYNCLFCTAQFEEGDIYSVGSRLVDAEKAVKSHIIEKHDSVFNRLLETEKNRTGLTDVQKEFLRNYYAGITDKEIAEKMNVSASTVRFQRYNFREKVKQAKMILALGELLEEKESKKDTSVAPTPDTGEKLDAFFISVTPLVLKTFNVKQKNQQYILDIIIKQFEKNRKYTENEVNEILKQIYADYVQLRRSLIDFGLMTREKDGEEYWVI